ncbi:ATP-binding protein [Streptomyces sp. NPDC015346]|uniref:ATP-binding protein n=1 Tax=Streptomyces sp. NPDC015346 TaxID=3364954 RepID=UPI0036F96C7C
MGCADLTAVPEVRHALRKMLRKWGGPGASDVAELLTSELVTNALIHTDHGAVVTATVVPDSLRVEVRDFVSGLTAPHPLDVPAADNGTDGTGSDGTGSDGTGSDGTGSDGTDTDVVAADGESTNGRGLVLVQALADSWGVENHGVGKVVWFELNGGAAAA